MDLSMMDSTENKERHEHIEVSLIRAGQRRINLIWEWTQSIVSILVTMAMIYLAITMKTNETMTNAFFLIVGFYFSRTNHSATGGVGPKAFQEYLGR